MIRDVTDTGVLLQVEGLMLLRLLRRAAVVLNGSGATGGNSVVVGRWVHQRNWQVPHRVLEASHRFPEAATLRRLTEPGLLASHRWKIAERALEHRGGL